MSIVTLLCGLCRRPRTTGRVRRRLRAPFAPRLESLEDRALLSGVSFSPATSYDCGATSVAVAVGDFNGDGRLDLATANRDSNSVGVLLGNGDGTFQAARDYAVGGLPHAIAVGDFNGDGNLDLAAANTGSNTVSVLLGNGDGTFQTASNFATGSLPSSVAVGDFNGDGKLDLAVGTLFGSPGVSVLLGNGDGTFQTRRDQSVLGLSNSVAVADLNRDGKLDIVTDGAVLLGNGDGTFQAAQSYQAGFNAVSVAAGDFNGDGRPDLAVANSSGFDGVSVLLGNGNGSLQTAVNYTTGAFPTDSTSVAVADFNGDGNVDLSVANEGGQTVGVLLGNGDGTFQAACGFPTSGIPAAVAVGDFNGDGRPDLVTAGGGVSVLLNERATTTTLRGPTSSTYGQPITYTATVTSSGAPVTAGTVVFLSDGTPISPALPVDGNGRATFTIATSDAGRHTITASYSGTPDGAGTTGWGPGSASASLNVAPFVLTGSPVNFSAVAGAPFTGTIATFTNPIASGSTANYYATIDWGDGSSSTATITSAGTLTVSGSHTYADPGSYALTLQVSNFLGNTTAATVSPTATVTTLGQNVQGGLTGGIGFWHNKNGQALINAFNGGPDATALSSWLAMNFPNLYGGLSGVSNAQVAAFYQSQLAPPGPDLAAEVLATALSVYATTQSLGGTTGQPYGFTLTAAGLGADSFNVGAEGAAFGVANNTTRNVYELLKAVDQQSAFGSFYSGNTPLQKEAGDLLDALSKAGAI